MATDTEAGSTRHNADRGGQAASADLLGRVGLLAAAVMGVVGLSLPWASNSIVGDDGAGDVLLGDGVMLAAVVLGVAVPLAIVGLLVGTRRSLLGGVTAAGAALLALVACSMDIRSQTANSIGEDLSTGQIIEDWADSHPGSGFYLFGLAVVVVLVIAGQRFLATRRSLA